MLYVICYMLYLTRCCHFAFGMYFSNSNSPGELMSLWVAGGIGGSIVRNRDTRFRRDGIRERCKGIDPLCSLFLLAPATRVIAGSIPRDGFQLSIS